MRTTALALAVTTALAGAAGAADLRSGNDVLERAQVLVARHAWAEAASAYQEVIAASPRDATPQNQLGICYQRLGDVGAARRAYERAIQLKKDYAAAYNNLGTLEHTSGRYRRAISAYDKAIAIKPEAAFYKNLGTAWLARGEVERALAAWSEAIRLDPVAFDGGGVPVGSADVDLARQYYLFAKLVAARGRLDQAFEYLVKAHAAGFDDFTKLERDRDFARVVSDPRYAALK